MPGQSNLACGSTTGCPRGKAACIGPRCNWAKIGREGFTGPSQASGSTHARRGSTAGPRQAFAGAAQHTGSARAASSSAENWRPAPSPPRTKNALAREADVVYIYDGSWPGFFCCVHESVYSHEIPAAIYPEDSAQPTMYATRLVETDPEKAQKVKASIPAKISPRAMELVENAFLTCLEQKELAMLRFLLLGYREGSAAPWMMGHPDVVPLLNAEKHRMGEAHLLKGFIRFSDYDGVLAATITPKNFVLNELVKHFVGRYSEEDFLIFDKTHKAALVYQNRKPEIISLEEIDFPVADEAEEQYRALWRRFYKTIAIEARTNHRCRRTHMPKRYWANMTEMQEYL